MSTFNAFTSSTFPDKRRTLSWTLEGEAITEPHRGTLELLGDYAVSVGARLTIDGDSYVVTSVTPSIRGARKITTLLVRDTLYDLYNKHSLKNIVWMTGPKRLVKGAQLDAVRMPVITEIRAKEGGVFGTGGWMMSEIVRECAAMLGVRVSYALPDFQVKQLELQRGMPIVSFLVDTLSAMLPRCFVRQGTLYLVPSTGTLGSAGTLRSVESIATATTLAEQFARFRVCGGLAVFKASKWEGIALKNKSTTSLTYALCPAKPTVRVATAGYGTRTYFTKCSGVQDVSVVEETYAKNAFDEDAYMVFRQEWCFLRKVPVLLNTEAAVKAVLDASREVVTGTDKPDMPSSEEYHLKECNRTVNVYAATTIDWEQPLLLESHKVRWMYVWWSSFAASVSADGTTVTNPPAPQTPASDSAQLKFPTGYPTKYDPSAQMGVTGNAANVVGVWSMDAYYEHTDYVYERMPDSKDANKDNKDNDYLGGLLLETNTVVMGQTRPTMPNLKRTSSGARYVSYEADKRVTPVYTQTMQEACPDQGYPGKKFYVVLRMRKESYREIGLRIVERKIREYELSPQDMEWYDPNTGKAQSYPNVMTNYSFSTTAETIPYAQAPQSIVQQRAMQCYVEKTGSGPRVVEVNVPHVVDWSDLEKVATLIWAAHPQFRNITTCNIKVPYKIHLPSVLGAKCTTPTGSGRVVAGTYNLSGDGDIGTQLAVQWEN